MANPAMQDAGYAYDAPEDAEMVYDVVEEQADEVFEETEEGEGDYETSGSSSDDEQDRREYGIHQCLPFHAGEPNWEEGEPQTVEEYLRRVRYEASQLLDVVTILPPPSSEQQHAIAAPHNQGQQQQDQDQERRDRVGKREHYSSHYLAADPGVPSCDPALRPSASWARRFLHQFAHLRRRLQREYELSCGQAAAGAGRGGVCLAQQLAACVARDATARAELEALSLDPPSACMPELQQLQGLDQLQVRRQLHSLICEAVRQEQVAPEVAAQLYALSARIEKPLRAGTCALYRQLLRLCAAQRAALGGGGAGVDDPLLPHLNILITLAGAFFGQDEELAAMWDNDEE